MNLRTALALALLLAGCSQRAADRGRALFSDPTFSQAPSNAFSCATCHRVDAAPQAIQIGYSLREAAFRSSFFGGNERRLLDAVSFCATAFMRAPAAVDAADPDGRALYEYLVQLSPERQTAPLPFTVVENIRELPRGDATRGAEVYAAACKACHGELHTGAGKLTPAAVTLPEASIQTAGQHGQHGATPPLVVIEKVRHGQSFGVGGTMPPFSTEALSDADLGALLSYFAL